MRYVSILFLWDLILCLTDEKTMALSTWLFSDQRKPSETGGDHRRSKRSLMEFKSLMTCYQPWIHISNYVDYGCYCGWRGAGIPLDETDECCYHHDNCYDKYDKSLLGHTSYLTSYEYTCGANSTATCDGDANSELAQALCECDRAAAECFLRARHTFSPSLIDVDTDTCCVVPLTDCKVPEGAPHSLERLYDCERRIDEDKCCIDQGYNSYYHDCCEGKLHRKPDPDAWSSPTMSCCGQSYYDVAKRICCDGRLHRLPRHHHSADRLQCCGTHMYDTHKQRCEDFQVLPIANSSATIQ